ncbi:MAG: hypothetical protein ACM3ZE_18290 [Myxococcales bacterium]
METLSACLDAATLAQSVAFYLKREQIDRHLELAIRGNPLGEEGVTIEVRRDGQTVGTRTFPTFTDPWDEVLSAIAVAVAMTIDATEHEPRPDKVAVAATSQPKQEVALKKSPPRTKRAATGVDVLALWGVLPGWALGLAPHFAYSVLPNWALRASLLGTTRGSLELSGGSVEMRTLAGRLDVCGSLLPETFRLRVCGGVMAGRLSVVGSNFARAISNGEQQRLLLGGVARFDVRLPLVGGLGVTAFADLFVRFTNSDVSVSNGDNRPMVPVGGMLGAGPELRFWLRRCLVAAMKSRK